MKVPVCCLSPLPDGPLWSSFPKRAGNPKGRAGDGMGPGRGACVPGWGRRGEGRAGGTPPSCSRDREQVAWRGGEVDREGRERRQSCTTGSRWECPAWKPSSDTRRGALSSVRQDEEGQRIHIWTRRLRNSHRKLGHCMDRFAVHTNGNQWDVSRRTWMQLVREK